MSMRQCHGQYVLSMIVPFVVQHPPEWHPIHHWWQCGQNCPCCSLPKQPIIQFPRIALLDQIQIDRKCRAGCCPYERATCVQCCSAVVLQQVCLHLRAVTSHARHAGSIYPCGQRPEVNYEQAPYLRQLCPDDVDLCSAVHNQRIQQFVHKQWDIFVRDAIPQSIACVHQNPVPNISTATRRILRTVCCGQCRERLSPVISCERCLTLLCSIECCKVHECTNSDHDVSVSDVILEVMTKTWMLLFRALATSRGDIFALRVASRGLFQMARRIFEPHTYDPTIHFYCRDQSPSGYLAVFAMTGLRGREVVTITVPKALPLPTSWQSLQRSDTSIPSTWAVRQWAWKQFHIMSRRFLHAKTTGLADHPTWSPHILPFYMISNSNTCLRHDASTDCIDSSPLLSSSPSSPTTT